jgi:hypothetical protein
MKSKTRKLKIARETLARLEPSDLGQAAGGATNERSVCVCQTNQDSICICETHICVSLNYTGCALCDS